MLRTQPPAVPPSRKSGPWRGHADNHLMMWVRSGRAHVVTADGTRHRVEAGSGIWLPPGPDHHMWTEPATVAFPIGAPARALPNAPTEVARFSVRPDRHDRLIRLFVAGMTPGGTYSQAAPDLLDVFSHATPYAARPEGRADPAGYPPLPTSPGARKVARQLLANPALDLTVDQWAGTVACSPITLRRDFLRDTGLPFGRWRTRCRLAAAGDLLAAGREVSQVAARCGFASRNGFTRAFGEEYGMTPREYAEQVRALRPTPRRHLVRGSASASNVWDDTHRVNVLTWVYRGRARDRIGARTFARARGDSVWHPAGVESETSLPEGSLTLPISVLCTDCAQIPASAGAHFPPEWDDYLLHSAVATNTLLQPEGYDRRDFLRIFGDQRAAERARTVPMPRDVTARSVAQQYLRTLGVRGGGAAEAPAAVHESFRQELGMSFTGWQRAARMSLARQLLADGKAPSSVATRLGYAHLPNFTRAFTRFHGLSPTDWQGRELEPPEVVRAV